MKNRVAFLLRNVLVFIVLGCASGAAWSASIWHKSTIRTVYPQADGSFVLRLSADSVDCSNQNVPKYYKVATDQNGVTDEGRRQMYAAALAAAAAGKEVTINFDSDTTSCYVNRLLVDF